MALPLEGIKVIDLSQVWAVPGAAMYLGDQGASVIKVEPPWGDEARRLQTTKHLGNNARGFLVVNRNKRGMCVDIRTPKGLEIICRLAKEADVLMINTRPGVAERLGLGYEPLHKLNPRLVYVSVTPFGRRGEWAGRRGLDGMFRALAGQMGREVLPDGSPAPGGKHTADTAGAVMVAFAAMLALFKRERTGIGEWVDTTMLGAGLVLQAVGLVKAYDDPNTATNNRAKEVTLYRCSDGPWLSTSVTNPDDWKAFCRILGIEDMGTPENYRLLRSDPESQETFAQVIAGVFETRPRDEWIKLLHAADLAVAPVLQPEEVFEYPHLLENRMLTDVQHPTVGRVRMFAPPIRVGDEEAVVRRPSPLLGQHTDEVLAELGYSAAEVQELRAEKVVM